MKVICAAKVIVLVAALCKKFLFYRKRKQCNKTENGSALVEQSVDNVRAV